MEANRLFQIEDFSGQNTYSLMGKSPIIEAKSNSEALKKYLKQNNLDFKVKCSADNDVQFGIIPMIMYNGNLLIDGRKKKTWYKIINY